MADANETPSPRRNFTLYFMLAMTAVSAGVFFSFRGVMRSSLAERREVSRSHLQTLHQGLKAYAAENNAAYPEELSLLHPQFIPDSATFFHPAWPERPGYVYVTGLRASDPPESLTIYENIPPGKEKLQRLVLRLNGTIESWPEAEFQQRLARQAAVWQAEKRPWQPQPVKIEKFMQNH